MKIQRSLQLHRLDRRSLLGLAGRSLAAASLDPWGITGGSAAGVPLRADHNQAAGYGDLVTNPTGRLALSAGFQYVELSARGGTLNNGEAVPSWHGGMAAFAGLNGATILVRNHEVGYGEDETLGIVSVKGTNLYDAEGVGGTTAIVVGPSRTELDSYVTSSGTFDNCAGGATP